MLTLPPLPLTVVTLELVLQATTPLHLPRWKGSLLRGGLGRALRAALCEPSCPAPETCPRRTPCAYRTLFAPDNEAEASELQGVRDVTRPYAVRPPLDAQTAYPPGALLPFEVVLIGRAGAYIPQILHAFTMLGHRGLGLTHGQATLHQATSLAPLTGQRLPLLRDGIMHNQLCTTNGASLHTAAAQLPPRLTLHFATPCRLKHAGRYVTSPECHVLVRAALRRLSQLCAHYGDTAWEIPFGDVIREAEAVRLEACHTQWVDWSRTSGATNQHMTLGGFVGQATYSGLSPAVRLVLLAGALVQIGKATVFGHGAYRLTTPESL